MLRPSQHIIGDVSGGGARERSSLEIRTSFQVGYWIAVNGRLVFLVAGSCEELPVSGISPNSSCPYEHMVVRERTARGSDCPQIGLGGSSSHNTTCSIPERQEPFVEEVTSD